MADNLSTDEMVSRAIQLHAEGKLAEAESLYRDAAQAGHVGSMGYLGSLYHSRGDLKEAESWYLSAVAAGDVEATINLATLRSQQSRFLEAEGLFQTVLQSPLATAHFASFLASQDRLEEAVLRFRRAIPELPTPSARAHAELGDLLTRLGRLEEAVAEYRIALETVDSRTQYHDAALQGLGIALEGLDRSPEAEALYRDHLKDEDRQLALAA